MTWLNEPETEPIPGYRLIEPLGSGGFGEVWKCEAPGGIFKAIKFVYGNLNTLDSDSAKAEQEFKAIERVKSVRHPFVLSMDRIEVVSGELLIVMELADRSLHDLFEEYAGQGRIGIPKEELLGYLSDAAEGLDHMIEKHQIQHLDVKPKNLFLVADRVKVADFGLARHLGNASSDGMMGGITPVYSSPETFTNKISKHSDQYSLAIVYVDLLSGQKPFNGKNIRQLAMQHMTAPPDLSMIDEHDRAIVAKALAKNPEERYPTCSAFIRALAGIPETVFPGIRNSGIFSMSLNRSVETKFPDAHQTTPPLHPSQERSHKAFQSPAAPAKPSTGSPPSLVTLGTRQGSGVLPQLRTSKEVQRSQALRPETPVRRSTPVDPKGVLRPAILVGVGSFGRRALQQIRCRLLDRLGQLSKIPSIRFLYLDTDPEVPQKLNAHSSDNSLQEEHVIVTPLQQVNAYRRKHLEMVSEWLPKEKLYAIPRNLRVDSSRALGRLAFSDNYLRFTARLKQEIQAAIQQENLEATRSYCQMPFRTTTPSIYLFVSASGGTSGMTLDVGHAIRRTLEKLNYSDAQIQVFILTGSPDDPTAPKEELANIFASLTELNHFSDPERPFRAQYGGPEGVAVDTYGLPFDATYLLPMQSRNSEAFRDAVSHLAGYISYDLTTPLGGKLDDLRLMRVPVGRSPFRGFGTFGIWYPRGLLIRSAARQACIELVRQWAASANSVPNSVQKQVQQITTDPRLTPPAIRDFIAQESGRSNHPAEELQAWIKESEQQMGSMDKNSNTVQWVTSQWDQLRDWLGLEPTTAADSSFRRGRLSRQLDQGLKRVIEAWGGELRGQLDQIMAEPGPRLGTMDRVIQQLITLASTAIETCDLELASLSDKRERLKAEVQNAINQCQAGGAFSLFGNRVTKALKSVHEAFQAFGRCRIQEDLAVASQQFYHRLFAHFTETLKEIRSASERLDHLVSMMEAPILLNSSQHTGLPSQHELIEEATQTTLAVTNTIRVVLPHGEHHLDRAASELLQQIEGHVMLRLEHHLTEKVLQPKKGLLELTRSTTELAQQLAMPMIDATTVFLTDFLPQEDVTKVEWQMSQGSRAELTRRLSSCLAAAAPLTRGPSDCEKVFILHPDTESGQQYAENSKKEYPSIELIPLTGAANDLVFCREQLPLRLEDVYQMFEPCIDAYEELLGHPQLNPHSRFDIVEWQPLLPSPQVH